MGLTSLFRGKPTRDRVWVGMFGKHPAWDDHVHTSRIETDALVELRTLLYTRGIGGRIDSGAWDRLGSYERLGAFAHTLVWRRDQDVIAARLVASVDGKGRERYPLVVCAHCRGLPLDWVCGEAVDRIAAAADSCRAAKTRDGAIKEIDRARDALRAESESVGADPGDKSGDGAPVGGGRPAVVVIDSRGGRETLDRLVYCARRDMRAFVRQDLLDERRGSRSRVVDASPKHLRLGAFAEAGGEACGGARDGGCGRAISLFTFYFNFESRIPFPSCTHGRPTRRTRPGT